MKKKVFAIFIMACLAFNASSAVCNSINYFTVSICNGNNDEESDMLFPTIPRHTPAKGERSVSATYDAGLGILRIAFEKNLGDGNITICCDGHEIISGDYHMNAGEAISYALEHKRGEYEICITTYDGDTFIGIFHITTK